MSKKISGNGYVCKQGYESSFLSDVIETYNSIPESDIEAQIAALKNVIVYIKRASAEGMTPDEIEDAILYNMSNLFDRIKFPTLSNFYQLRTLEYMMDLDLEPYVVEVLTKGIDLRMFEEDPTYSANVAENVYTELYGLLKDIADAPKNTTDTQFLLLCKKIKNASLTIKDKDLVMKYVDLYLKQISIGKSTYWDNQRKDLEACRKLLIKHKDDIFDVKIIDFSAKKTDGTENSTNVLIPDIRNKEKVLLDKSYYKDAIPVSSSIRTLGFYEEGKQYKQIGLKDFVRTPFIGNDADNNFLIIMSESLRKLDPKSLHNFYMTLMASEYDKSAKKREIYASYVNSLIGSISFDKNLLRSRECLMERICTLMLFYRASGCLAEYCDVNNKRLNRIYLGDLQIDEDTLFSKFVNKSEMDNQYFINENIEFGRSLKDMAIANASDEAIIGMSAFYTNRMTKKVPTYSMLGYILDKTSAIEKICDNPDLEYEDLQYTKSDIATYMAMYKCFQRLMIKNYFSKIPTTQALYETDAHKSISKELHSYKAVYENAYPNMGFYFERDIDFVMMDARLIQELYDLKSFSVNSLLYTAITDKKKNIMNWGFVPGDEQGDEKFALLGFDIKSLNTPLFVHMKREDLVKFLLELTDSTEIPVYEGANDMYSYSIRQRVTAQVLYPLSKDEKKKLLKLEGVGNQTDYYRHVRWLQQGKKEPFLGHAPGSRVYDFKTKKIEKAKKPFSSVEPKANSKKKKIDNGDR